MADAISRSYGDSCEPRPSATPVFPNFSSISALYDAVQDPSPGSIQSLGDAQSVAIYKPSELLNVPLVRQAQLAEPGLKVWADDPRYAYFNGLLYRLVAGNGTRLSHPLLCLPRSLQQSAFTLAHDDASAGHPGIRGTLAHLRRRVWWATMEEDAKEYVETCPVCQASKRDYRVKSRSLASSKVLVPHHRIAVDWAGPFTYIKAKWYVAVFVDSFSGFTQFYPTRSDSASDFQFCLAQWCSAFGTPQEILSDNGPPFNSDAYRQVCATMGCEPIFASPYHPSSNGQAENRVYRLKSFVSQYVTPATTGDREDKFISGLPLAAMVINTNVDANGFTSFFLHHGFACNTPLDNVMRRPDGQPAFSADEDFTDCYQRALDLKRRHIVFQSLNYTPSSAPADFHKGEVVRVKNQSKTPGADSHVGPYRIVAVHESSSSTAARYDLELLETASRGRGRAALALKRSNVHPDHLKHCPTSSAEASTDGPQPAGGMS